MNILPAHQWDLWSTTARLVVTDPALLDAGRDLAQEMLDRIDVAASRFRADSELRNLRRGADGGCHLSPVLADLMGEALRAAELSEGAVDPTVGAALADIGYIQDISLVRKDDRPVRLVVRRVPGWRSLRLQGDRLFAPEGVRLDLGATAKAVAADRVAETLAARLGTGVLISLGGDIATAGPAPETGWQVLVQDVPADPPSHITLTGGAAVATSSSVRRTWQRDGTCFHHIIDPATSQPAAQVWRSVTAVAQTCVEANTITTAALVKGLAATGWIGSLGQPARLVARDGHVVLLNGWPEEVAA